MFPTLRVSFSGRLEPHQRYDIYLDMLPVDNKRYRYAYHRSSWIVAGKADPAPVTRLYRHPDSPFSGEQLARGTVVSFEKLKLTNNIVEKSGHVSHISAVLNGYIDRLIIVGYSERSNRLTKLSVLLAPSAKSLYLCHRCTAICRYSTENNTWLIAFYSLVSSLPA